MNLVVGQKNIEFAGLSDIGVRRSNNQDAFVMLPAEDCEQYQRRGHVFLVADGMGAHAVGELASKLAVDSIPHIYAKHAHEGPVGALRRAFLETNTAIHTRGQQNREFEGMGTTSTALLLRPEGAWISHVGDSRVYRIRDGKMEQLSFDHSLVWEMAKRRRCQPEEVDGVPNNVIVRSLGPEPLVQVDIEGPHELQEGDQFILCSDGLSGPLSDCEIGAIASALPPEVACQVLVDLTNLQGGPDNITCIVVRIGDDEDSALDLAEPSSRPATARKQVQDRFPWPILSLGCGILFAVAAVLLTINRMATLSTTFFALAAFSLIAGMIGILFFQRNEERIPVENDDGEPPKVYRETSCAAKAAHLEKLSQACTSLESQLWENDWRADWDVYRAHRKSAEDLAKRKQLQSAFRESCLAFLVLTEAAKKNGAKQYGRSNHIK